MHRILDIEKKLQERGAQLIAEGKADAQEIESLRERTHRLIAESEALIARANALLAEAASDAEPKTGPASRLTSTD